MTVDGAVIQPGIYPISGETTLLQVLALAQGPAELADLHQIAVFRTSGAQRTQAVFDLAAIRTGQAADLRILANDVGSWKRRAVGNSCAVSAMPFRFFSCSRSFNQRTKHRAELQCRALKRTPTGPAQEPTYMSSIGEKRAAMTGQAVIAARRTRGAALRERGPRLQHHMPSLPHSLVKIDQCACSVGILARIAAKPA